MFFYENFHVFIILYLFVLIFKCFGFITKTKVTIKKKSRHLYKQAKNIKETNTIKIIKE